MNRKRERETERDKQKKTGRDKGRAGISKL